MMFRPFLALILTMPLMGCLVGTTDPLFSDISRNPPPITEQTADALKADRPFGEWVLYQNEMCERFGCTR